MPSAALDQDLGQVEEPSFAGALGDDGLGAREVLGVDRGVLEGAEGETLLEVGAGDDGVAVSADGDGRVDEGNGKVTAEVNVVEAAPSKLY